MGYTDNIKNLNVPSDTKVTLSYSDSCDVFVHNDTAVDTAISETDVISTFSELVTTPGFNVKSYYGTPVMESLRDEGYFDDYERGSYTFTEYVADVITENFYDQEFVESSVEQYDYKRGNCELSATLTTTVEELLSSTPHLFGWTIEVPTDNGTVSFSG